MRRYRKVDRESGTKECADCQSVRSLSDFHIRKSGAVYPYCKACNVKRAMKWSTENRERKNAGQRVRHALKPPEWRRNKHYRAQYGVSYDDVRSLLEKQDFRCAICVKEIDEKTAVVDHCHNSEIVRGVLCNLCNISLAPIEREGFLDTALAYLERHRSKS